MTARPAEPEDRRDATPPVTAEELRREVEDMFDGRRITFYSRPESGGEDSGGLHE